jgi:prefoldin subunit 5
MLNENEHFVDLGESYYIERNPQRKIKYLLKKLDALGWQPPTPVTA